MEKETGMDVTAWDQSFRGLAKGRRLKIGRRGGLALVALLLSAAIVSAAVTLMLSNTARQTGTVAVFNADWTASGTLPSALTALAPATISAGYLRNSPAKDYQALGFASVCFEMMWSNRTAADFDSLTINFLPSNDDYTKASLVAITHPTNPAISGVGLQKCYMNGQFTSLPAAGSSATMSGTITLSASTNPANLEQFEYVIGNK